MPKTLLLLLPVLIVLAACSETIDAQESPAGATDAVEPSADEKDKAPAVKDEVDLKLRSPVGID